MFFSILILSVMLIYLSKFLDSTGKKFFCFIGFSLPLILATFRGVQVGTDTSSYYYSYNYYGSRYNLVDLFTLNGIKEYFNTILIYLNYNYFNFNFYLLIYAIITMFFMYKAINYYLDSEKIFLAYSIFLFMSFPTELNIMRQMAALSMLFWGFKFVFEKQFLKFVIIVILASGFHITSIILLPFYFIVNKQKKLATYFPWILLIFIILIVLNFNSVIVAFSSLDNNFSRYSFYESSTSRVNKIFFLNVFIFLLSTLILKFKGNKQYNIFIMLLFVGLLFDLLGFSSPFLKRLSLYFNVFQIVTLSQILSITKKKYHFMIEIFLLLMLIGYYCIYYRLLGFAHVFPYSFYIYPT